MPSLETNSQTFRTLILTRSLCLGLMFLLFILTESGHASHGVVAGWNLLIVALVLSPVFWVLGRIKGLVGWLMPVMFLMDSLLVGAWVTVSGGAVSFYMPYFLLLLVAAILVLTRRKALVVVLLIFGVFFATLYADFVLDLPQSFDAGKTNFVDGILDRLSPEVREGLYWQQSIRWLFFFLMMCAACVLLMRQVWVREERLRAREKALEQKRHLIQMGELTGRIAHGVNTPLGLISGNLELLMAETRKGSKTQKNLIQIEQYVQRAIRTVRDILDFSRQSMSEIKSVSISEILQAVTRTVQPKLKKAGGQLILDIEPKLPEITGYPESLFQALLNLVENAVDSIRPGGVITLSASFQYRSMRLSPHDRRGEVKLAVRDNGRGIPTGELKRIFEPFYSTKGFGKGTGLGLSIVKRIVDEHGGQIRVESHLGEGTVFTLLIPTDGLVREGANNPEKFHYNEPIPLVKEPAE
ncbi:MAG TPA: ATP-binding protein [bacterium]|nr:ATP-binding protein [bacterium]